MPRSKWQLVQGIVCIMHVLEMPFTLTSAALPQLTKLLGLQVTRGLGATDSTHKEQTVSEC